MNDNRRAILIGSCIQASAQLVAAGKKDTGGMVQKRPSRRPTCVPSRRSSRSPGASARRRVAARRDGRLGGVPGARKVGSGSDPAGPLTRRGGRVSAHGLVDSCAATLTGIAPASARNVI